MRRIPAPAATKTLQTIDDLVAASLVGKGEAAALDAVAERYSVAVTPEMAALIDAADPEDPIALQFLPDARELDLLPQERADPIGDDAHSPLPGIVHRYRDRVLLKLLTICPIYCRFCFRRESVGRGKGDVLSGEAAAAALDYIAARPQIFEVILTGGDPFALSARRLADVAARLATIEHVGVLRLHTRAPTAAPALVDPQRLAALQGAGKALHVVLHVNHARELAPPALEAIRRLRGAGATLHSQSVLLKGVNDDAATLEALCRALLREGVRPYYLHHPDLAPGTAHFRLSIAQGRLIHAELARRVSGLALPRYVLDIPGGFGKTPIEPGFIEELDDGSFLVRDREGREHAYP